MRSNRQKHAYVPDHFLPTLGEEDQETSREAGKRAGDLDIQDLCMQDLRVFHVRRSMDEQKAIAHEYRSTRELDARDKLLQTVVFWVIKLAHKYSRWFEMPHLFLDLVQEGMLGVFVAIDRYEPKTYAFSTYATWWIRAHMVRFLHNHANDVRIPARRHELLERLWKSERYLCQKLGREIVDDDLIVHGFATREEIDEINKTPHRRVVSIEEPINRTLHEDDGSSIVDVLHEPYADHEHVVRRVETSDVCEKISDFLRSTYSAKCAQAVILRFGLNGVEPMTLSEVGKALPGGPVTDERARQLIDKTLTCPRFRWFLQTLFAPASEGKIQSRAMRSCAPADSSDRKRGSLCAPVYGSTKTRRAQSASHSTAKPPIQETHGRNLASVERFRKEDLVATTDISSLTNEELEALQRETQRLLDLRQFDATALELGTRWVKEAAAHGVTALQIVERYYGLVGTERRTDPKVPTVASKQDKRAGGKIEHAVSGATYKHPTDHQLIWRCKGTGEYPSWLKELLSAGHDLASLQILVLVR